MDEAYVSSFRRVMLIAAALAVASALAALVMVEGKQKEPAVGAESQLSGAD